MNAAKNQPELSAEDKAEIARKTAMVQNATVDFAALFGITYNPKTNPTLTKQPFGPLCQSVAIGKGKYVEERPSDRGEDDKMMVYTPDTGAMKRFLTVYTAERFGGNPTETLAKMREKKRKLAGVKSINLNLEAIGSKRIADGQAMVESAKAIKDKAKQAEAIAEGEQMIELGEKILSAMVNTGGKDTTGSFGGIDLSDL